MLRPRTVSSLRDCGLVISQVIQPKLVGVAGFEPAVSGTQNRRLNQAGPYPVENCWQRYKDSNLD